MRTVSCQSLVVSCCGKRLTLSTLLYVLLFGIAVIATAADIPKVPVPSSPYLPVIYRYADTMIEHGRDVYGPQKTGLFLSALDRVTMAPLTNGLPRLAGIRDLQRIGGKDLAAANPQHDQNLLRLLYTLSELSGKPK